MKTLSKVFLSLSIIILVSCQANDELTVIPSDKLIGYWINPVVTDSIWKYEKASSFKENNSGFSFKSGQVFVERKNAGWCGTPPIAYDNFNGIWAQKDSLINITVDYWGGVASYQWKIISIDDKNLIICKLKEEYQSK